MPTTEADALIDELLHKAEGRRNPYPLYHRLRDAAPVYRAPWGTWFLTRYVDCAAALRDPRLGKDYPRQTELRFGPEWRRHPSLENGERSMVNLDGAAHTRLRRLVVKAFTPRTVEALRPKIGEAVDRLLAPLAERGGGDVFEHLAFPLPVNIIGELLGVPEADRPQFRTIARDTTLVFEARPTPQQLEAADRGQRASRTYFKSLIAEKRRHPGDDLLSRLIATQDGEAHLSDDELLTMGGLLFAAGFETTTHLIGNGLFGLLHHPDELERLRREPPLLMNLPDELLRYDGTAQMTTRFTKTDIDVGGVTIPEGETVTMVLGAANHDPARYPNPDRLDVGRTDIQPLSFGGGIHYCLGAALAEVEIEIVFRKLLERFGAIELEGEPPRFRDRLALRGLESLQIACRPAARGKAARPLGREASGRTESRSVEPGGQATFPLRPPAGADSEWRNALRARVESEAAGQEARRERLLDTIVLLARAPLFRACTADELAELALTAYPMSFEPGERLCVEGGESLECYVISEGEATVTIGGRFVRSVGEDDVVGERGLIEDRTRTATVAATTHVNTWAISRERLLALLERSPGAKTGMLEYVRRRYEGG